MLFYFPVTKRVLFPFHNSGESDTQTEYDNSVHIALGKKISMKAL